MIIIQNKDAAVMPKTKNSLTSYLRTIPLFASLKEETLKSLGEYASDRLEPKGRVLFSPDSPNDKFYIVQSGWVKLFRETMSGEEAVIDTLTANNFFGEIGLAGTETMPYGAEVIEDARIVSIPRFLLAEEVMRNSLFGLAVLQSLTRQKMHGDLEIEHRTVQTAPQRIGCFLLKFCKGDQQGDIVLHLPYEKAVIANRLGMTPETFSRALNQLKNDVGITVKGSTITIKSLKSLVDFTCSACSSNFPCEK
jgi:CRP-like cAMP-binding protein